MRNSLPGTTCSLAYRRASKGKRSQPAVAAFEYRLEDHLLALQDALRTHTYRPGAYTHFFIHEPKRRLISAAPFRDRVVHHALCNLIEPIFERTFVADSYANRLGKGTHRALQRVQELARQYPYVLQCDLRQFFPSVDHAILRGILARKLTDSDVLWLIDRILESGRGVLSEVYTMVYFPGDDLFAVLRPRGLPIGNLTSQFWANVYLNPFDHFVKRTLRCSSNSNFSLCCGLAIAHGGGLRLRWAPFSHEETAMTQPLSFDDLQTILRHTPLAYPTCANPAPITATQYKTLP